MAQRIEHHTFTVPANTPSSSPYGEGFVYPDGIVDQLQVSIPRGHANLTGIAILYSLQQIIPAKVGQFIRGNNQVRTFDLEDYPTGQGFSFDGFNNDHIAHSFHIEFLLDEIPLPADPTLAPLVLLPFAGDISIGDVSTDVGDAGSVGGGLGGGTQTPTPTPGSPVPL